MRKSIIILHIFVSIIISGIINTSYAIDCTNSTVIATSSCTTQPTQVLSSPATYSEVTTLSPNPCCLQNCAANAFFINDNCSCNTGFYLVGTTSCEPCEPCATVNSTCTLTTYSNMCVWMTACLPGYGDIQNEGQYNASCSALSYTVTLNSNGGSGGTPSVTAVYNNPMPTITSFSTRSGYVFNGYFDAVTGGTKYYNSDGSSAHVWNKTANTTLYAQWTQCTTPILGGETGDVYLFVASNQCRYYINCFSGFESEFYDTTHYSTNSILECTPCTAGYFCPGGVHQPCAAGKTSDGGVHSTTEELSCYIKGGSDGTKFCDINGCFYIPHNVKY
ncbi:MAG: InlB B-repeat-containing protein [Alphaproteobacteria bacterium]|nr:InlB B-repeat-containing protein [Alphaproteobacteria bacterium]MBN2675053.1 InlB B-repeat-containing protein [Alphaproteobacteria bacterium]